MNPLTNVKNQQKLAQRELDLGIAGTSSSWHRDFTDSAWVFVGGLPFDLSEGDIVCIFSQYGEIVNINLVRDKGTGKSKGYCFICYEDQRSTVLACDNLNGIKVLERTIRVNHVADYRMPKEQKDEDDITKKLREEGCAPVLRPSSDEEEEQLNLPIKRSHKERKKKKVKKEKRKKMKKLSRSPSSEKDSPSAAGHRQKPGTSHMAGDVVKREKIDSSYEKYARRSHSNAQHDGFDAAQPGDGYYAGKEDKESGHGAKSAWQESTQKGGRCDSRSRAAAESQPHHSSQGERVRDEVSSRKGREKADRDWQSDNKRGRETADRDRQSDNKRGRETADRDWQSDNKMGRETADRDRQSDNKRGRETADRDWQSDNKMGRETADRDRQSDSKRGRETADRDWQSDNKRGRETADRDRQSDNKSGREPADRDRQSDNKRGRETADRDRQSDNKRGRETADRDRQSDNKRGRETADRDRQSDNKKWSRDSHSSSTYHRSERVSDDYSDDTGRDWTRNTHKRDKDGDNS